MGMKNRLLKGLIKRKTAQKPAPVPRSLLRKCHLSIDLVQGRRVWTLAPKLKPINTVVLFLHGGAYYGNMSGLHWRLVERLIDGSRATFIVPDYPLAPQSVCEDAYRFLDEVFAGLLADHPSKRLIFMGDSAGGGLALGFAPKISPEAIPQPEEIILFSPWLDVSMSHSDLDGFDQTDQILNIADLQTAGKTFAGKLDLKDFRISPLYGDLAGLARISVFSGGNEILHSDALRLRQLMEAQHIDYRFFEYPGMFHDWVLVPFLPESGDVIAKVLTLL